MLSLRFSGWCQIRLATDPDPFDEPAGASGRTVALAGEAPLDRVIRFHDPVDHRSGAPEVGVRVYEVCGDDDAISGHPLVGARVNLLDGPVFEGRNGLVADDGLEPIEPFALRIENDGGLVLQRTDPAASPWDPDDPDPAALVHRIGSGLQDSPEVEADVRDAARVHATEKAWLATRRRHLEAACEHADGADLLALKLRLQMLEPIAFVRVSYRFHIGQHGGMGTIDDPEHRLAERVDTGLAWPLDLWFGAWDGDGLVSFVHGELRLPLMP